MGGPLNYLSELRNRFIETLHLTPEQTIMPDDAHMLVAKGACLDSVNSTPISVEKLKSKIEVLKISHDDTTIPLKPLFSIDADYDDFCKRHDNDKVSRTDLTSYSGDCFVGIDARFYYYKTCFN